MKQSIIPTNFWDSAEMMALRGDPVSQTVAFYLVTSPRANVAGMYTCPFSCISKDTGLALADVTMAMQRLEKVGLCKYDHLHEIVWVRCMISNQIGLGKKISEKDSKIMRIIRIFDSTPDCDVKESFKSFYINVIDYLAHQDLSEEKGTPPLRPPYAPPTPPHQDDFPTSNHAHVYAHGSYKKTKEKDKEENKEKDKFKGKKKTSTNVDVVELSAESSRLRDGEDQKAKKSPALSIVKPPCPYEKISDLYHEILPELRRCRGLSDARKGFINQRWNDKPGPDLAKWRAYFEYVRQCPWLMGTVESKGDRQPFQADLEWLTRPTNFLKVIEGKYARAVVAAHG